MSNPNFVNDLVMMAKAFEELPIVTAQRDELGALLETERDTVRDREATILKLKQELDAAHAATRKAEVERDHAETMFLETDDKLNTLRGIFTHFTHSVDGFLKASEPVSIEPAPAAAPEPVLPPQEVNQAAPAVPYEPKPDADVIEALGQREPDPTVEASAGSELAPAASQPVVSQADASTETATDTSEGVSVSADPTPESDTSHASATSPEHSAPITPLQVSPMDGGDDVGYHNEPDIASPDWELWFDRMTARYGHRVSWPERDWTITRPINSQT